MTALAASTAVEPRKVPLVPLSHALKDKPTEGSSKQKGMGVLVIEGVDVGVTEGVGGGGDTSQVSEMPVPVVKLIDALIDTAT